MYCKSSLTAISFFWFDLSKKVAFYLAFTYFCFILMSFCNFFSGNIPSVTEKEDPIDKEQAAEDERLRQEAIKEAEEKRRVKHKKMEEERENMRQGIRDRVRIVFAV